MNTHIITDIAAGGQSSMFVTRNKQNQETEVFGCGLNLNGELAVGYLRHIQDVTKVEGLSNYRINGKEGDTNVRIKTISCGLNHCMALLDIGVVLEWGSNLRGQLGNKKRVSAENPVVVGRFKKSNIKSINCGYDSSAIITVDKPTSDKKAANS